ncbi:hypothetical protein BLOT_004136 [Blomia tropicalis]|nr:hypothetical protein BLOT_004136 [Blomia tropicalis]
MLLVTLQTGSGLNGRDGPSSNNATVTNTSTSSTRRNLSRRRESDTGVGNGIVVRNRNGTRLVTLNRNGAMAIIIFVCLASILFKLGMVAFEYYILRLSSICALSSVSLSLSSSFI